MPSMEELNDLFKNMVLDPKKPKKKAAPKSPLLANIGDRLKEEKAKARAKRGYQSGSGVEYVKVWNEEGTDYEYITKARAKWKEYYGTLPEEHQIVFFRDRRLKGDAKYAKENLVLGYRSGISLDLLTCGNCGCRGNWVPSSIPDGDEGGPE